MKFMTWLLMVVVVLSGTMSQTFAESADNHESRAIKVELGTIEAMLDAGVQQKLVAGMDATFPLNMDNIELIEELGEFHYLSASGRIAEDGGFLYKLVGLDPAYEYYKSDFAKGSVSGQKTVEIPSDCHIFFSAEDKIIGEYIRYDLGEDISFWLQVDFMDMARSLSEANFGYVAQEIRPPITEPGNYRFWLINDYGDELEFNWHGQYIDILLRAGDKRPVDIEEAVLGLFLLPQEEWENGVGH